jgi:hypothetical protein
MDKETPVVKLDDFNDWLRSMGSGNLVVEPDMTPSDEPAAAGPVKKLTTTEQQDERLRIFREYGGQDPGDTGRRWKGVTTVAARLGIKRQTLTAALKAAFARERRSKKWAEAESFRH